MEEMFVRIYVNMVDRVSGPMHFRIFLQPIMAAIFAIIAGIKDSKKGNPDYFWAMLTRPAERSELIREGWKSVGKIFILAAVLDIVYQYIVQRFVYPLEVLITATLLAIVPYLVLRGLVNRMASIEK